jgi:hypothetical protein
VNGVVGVEGFGFGEGSEIEFHDLQIVEWI